MNVPFLLSEHPQPLFPLGDASQCHSDFQKSGYCHLLFLLLELFPDMTSSP